MLLQSSKHVLTNQRLLQVGGAKKRLLFSGLSKVVVERREDAGNNLLKRFASNKPINSARFTGLTKHWTDIHSASVRSDVRPGGRPSNAQGSERILSLTL